MAIAPTFQRYLDQHVTYDVIAHEPTMSSMRTAQACHISGDCLAKGVVLRDATGLRNARASPTPAIRHVDRGRAARALQLPRLTVGWSDFGRIKRDFFVHLEPRFYEDQVRTFPSGSHRRHRGSDAQTCALRNSPRQPHHVPGLPQRRLACPLRSGSFDRRVERIHVDVNDLARNLLDHEW